MSFISINFDSVHTAQVFEVQVCLSAAKKLSSSAGIIIEKIQDIHGLLLVLKQILHDKKSLQTDV
jgi:hypothetical protein